MVGVLFQALLDILDMPRFDVVANLSQREDALVDGFDLVGGEEVLRLALVDVKDGASELVALHDAYIRALDVDLLEFAAFRKNDDRPRRVLLADKRDEVADMRPILHDRVVKGLFPRPLPRGKNLRPVPLRLFPEDPPAVVLTLEDEDPLATNHHQIDLRRLPVLLGNIEIE